MEFTRSTEAHQVICISTEQKYYKIDAMGPKHDGST